MKEDETVCIVDKHNTKMEITNNWVCGMRTTGRHERNDRKIDLLIKIRTSINVCRLKQRVRDSCKEEPFWISLKNRN